MVWRFCSYSVLKNLRFGDPFLVLYLLSLDLAMGEVGLLLGAQHLLTALLEVPLGVAADSLGRRRSLAACFLCHGTAFLLYPLAADAGGAGRDALLYTAALTFGLGEALRTGSHKAIMLDYLDSTGRSSEATRVIGLARTFSKSSSGVAALAAGVLLWLTADYRVLFWLSAAAAVAAFGLMLSYPRWLEGERSRERSAGGPAAAPSLRERWRALFAHPGLPRLFWQSVLFESQIKIMTKYFLPVYLASGLRAMGTAIIPSGGGAGRGALWIGANELVRDGLGGAGAGLSHAFERRAGGRAPALRLAFAAAVGGSAAAALCAWRMQGWFFVGLALFVGLTVAQNVRRPIFVSAFNDVMDKRQRATALSLESQARALAVSVLLPLAGAVADRWGLAAVFALTTAVLAAGLALSVRDASSS